MHQITTHVLSLLSLVKNGKLMKYECFSVAGVWVLNIDA